MPSLGLKNSVKSSVLSTPGIIRDSLVLKHDYNARSVVPVSDGAAYFDGTDDYIDTSTVLSTGTTLSWSLWMKTTDTSGWSGIIGSGNNPAYDKWLFRRNDDDTYGWIVDWNSHSEFPASAVEDNKWHHVAGTYDGTTIKLYLDGVLYDSDSESSHDIGGTGINIGAYMVSGSIQAFYGGYLCNIGVWTGVLTQAQIKSIMWKNYAGLTSSETTNLVSWWNLSADANDSTGTNNGTLS